MYNMDKEKLFDPQTIVYSTTSTPVRIFLLVLSYGICNFVFFTVVYATRTFSTLNSMKSSMSQRTKNMQWKLMYSLIIQVIFIIS